jgi:hypothetical protein
MTHHVCGLLGHRHSLTLQVAHSEWIAGVPDKVPERLRQESLLRVARDSLGAVAEAPLRRHGDNPSILNFEKLRPRYVAHRSRTDETACGSTPLRVAEWWLLKGETVQMPNEPPARFELLAAHSATPILPAEVGTSLIRCPSSTITKAASIATGTPGMYRVILPVQSGLTS